MRPALPVMAVRTFITPSMPVQKGTSTELTAINTLQTIFLILTFSLYIDVIQDLYLKELKNYKPAPVVCISL
jgi:hypothetical protein